MTVMPSARPAAPAPTAQGPGPGTSADASTAGTSAAGFLEMLLAALPTGVGTGGQPDAAGSTAVDPTGVTPQDGATPDPALADPAGDGADAEADGEQSTPGAAAQTGAAGVLPLLTSLPFAVSQALRLQTAPAAQADVSVAPTAGTASTTGTELADGVAPSVGTAGGDPLGGTDAGGRGTPAPATVPTGTPAGTPAGAQTAAGRTGETTQDSGVADTATTDLREARAPEHPTGATQPRPVDASAPGGIDVSSLTQVSGSSGVTGTGQAQGAAAAPSPTGTAPAPVAQQVFGEVSRLVSRGDGTHRLTMTLSPEALGDVRVTLTVRNGEVHVQFAAGDDAQRALLESAPELRRLLELTGATESRITVRDALATASSSGTGTGGSGTGGQNPGQGSTGQADPGTAGGQDPAGTRRDPQDHHAGTREGQNAMDGDHRGVGATRPPHDPGTSTRPAGLDVTV